MLQIFGWGEDAKENDESPSGRSASLSGYLWKMKREKKLVVPQWSKRWFSIEGRVLRWYNAANSENCSGEIELKDITRVSPFEAGGKGVFSFTVYYPDRNLLLRASSVSEMKMWVRAIELQADLARGGNGMMMLRKTSSIENKKKLKSHSLENELNRQMEELNKIQSDLDQSVGDSKDFDRLGTPIREESSRRQQNHVKSSPITSGTTKKLNRDSKQDSALRQDDRNSSPTYDSKNDSFSVNSKVSLPSRTKGSGGGVVGGGLDNNRILMDEEDNLLNNYIKDTGIDDSISSTTTNELYNKRGGGGNVGSRSGSSRPGSRPASSSTRNVSYNRYDDEDSRDRVVGQRGGGGRGGNHDAYYYDTRDGLGSPSPATDREMSIPRSGGRNYNNNYDDRGGGSYRTEEGNLFSSSRGGGGNSINRPSSYQKYGPDEEVADDDDMDYKADVRIRRPGGGGSGGPAGGSSRPGSGTSNRSSRDSAGSNNSSRRIANNGGYDIDETTAHLKRFEPRTMSAWT